MQRGHGIPGLRADIGAPHDGQVAVSLLMELSFRQGGFITYNKGEKELRE
jgi:hypothetical protein